MIRPSRVFCWQGRPEFTLNQRPSNREREMARMGLRMAGLSARISSSSFRHALETMVGSLEDEGIQSNAHPKFNQTYCLTSAEHTDETRALFELWMRVRLD